MWCAMKMFARQQQFSLVFELRVRLIDNFWASTPHVRLRRYSGLYKTLIAD